VSFDGIFRINQKLLAQGDRRLNIQLNTCLWISDDGTESQESIQRVENAHE
jgi:hypothetical protein